MSTISKFFSKLNFKIFNGFLSSAQLEMLHAFLQNESWWNPNSAPVFDRDWAVPHINGFLNEYAERIHEIPLNTEYGLYMLGFTYNGCHFWLNFAPQNPRVVTISVIDLEVSQCDKDGKREELKDNTLLKQMQSIANEYNKLDMRHLIRVGVLSDHVTPVIRISLQIILTPDIGDKEMIKYACDELLNYAVRFTNKAIENVKPSRLEFDEKMFLPSDRVSPEKDKDFWKYSDALEHWFGLHTQILFGKGEMREMDGKWIREIPMVFSPDDGEGIEVVAIPFGNHVERVAFTEDMLSQVKIIITNNNPFLYVIEARNLRELFGIKGRISNDYLKGICNQLTWNDHNQLVRAVWKTGVNGTGDMSLIASGLWMGTGQSFAKIEQIGEFMKNLAAAYVALQKYTEVV